MKNHYNQTLMKDKCFNETVPPNNWHEPTLQEKLDAHVRQKELAFREHENLGTNLYEQHMKKLRDKYKVSGITLTTTTKANETSLQDVSDEAARQAQQGFKLATAKVNVGNKPTRLWVDVKL